MFGSFSVPCFASTTSVRPAGHAKVPAEVPEDSRVLTVNH